VQSEIDAPSEPAEQQPSEFDTPADDPAVSELSVPDSDIAGELEVPDEASISGELSVPDQQETNPFGISLRQAEIQGRQTGRQRRRENTGTERFREDTRGADRNELDEILSGGGTIGEETEEPTVDDGGSEFFDEPRTVREIIDERQPREDDAPQADEQVGDPSLVEDLSDTGQGSVPGSDPLIGGGLTDRRDQTPEVDAGVDADVGQDPGLGVDVGLGDDTDTDADVTPGQQPETDVGIDVGQQPVTDILGDQLTQQEQRLAVEPTTPDTANPEVPTEATGPGPGFGNPPPTLTTTEPPTGTRTPRLPADDDDDEDEDPFGRIRDDTFGSGIADAQEVFTGGDDSADNILGR
jgi:hypothetical protein